LAGVLDVTRARGSLRGLIPAALFFVLAALIVAGLPWRCAFHQVTGLPCPTCGMTRAMRLALHGDFRAATQMHPLWFIVVPACVAVAVAEMAGYWRGGRWGTVIERRGVLSALGSIGVALMVVWIARLEGASWLARL
jgi:uncharacterized protein DUF2752